MLESAEKFQKAFERLEDHDTQYFRDFCLGEDKGAPTSLDWEFARCFIKFLKVFFDATLKFSGSLFVTSNTFLRHLCMVHSQLQNWCNSKDIFLKHMAENMKKKYDKYWGSYQVINPFLFIAVLLDPRHKQRLLRYCFALLWSEDKANEMTSRVINTLNELYYQYKVIYFANVEAIDNMHFANDMPADNDEIDADSLFNSGYMKLVNETDGVDNKTEVDQYLMESCENPNDENFDILCWWKIKSPKYKILSYVARDILAIPVSTVASESAFSTGGRILDSFRSSLSPRTVETLICTQNWLDSSSQISLGEMVNNMEELETGNVNLT
ncbi:hypothetical protein Dsin_003271 [Dipteronia sinensis]|uniref:Zinc finger BED domain-containing protein RICESLEEPER 2-like n=1 Tax=Dipteronia sinensis TaxID=43782 RepID=A0AAE0B8Q1_9ROSI|nr:hypothetical protein Dsin_003271 [Dipteronia sinensis]